jgi:ArsR family transcriptional regulator
MPNNQYGDVMENKAIYEARARIIKAMAHPTRLWMLEKLSGGECCVCKFVDAIDADFSTISKHLSVLKQAGIVEDEKRGKQVFYRLKVPCVMNFISCIESVIEEQSKKWTALANNQGEL